MRLGIIGLPNSGKTTIFNALTGQNLDTSAVSSGQFEVNTAIVNVPDPRLEALAKTGKSKKVVPTTINYTDIGGLDKGISSGGLSGPFRNQLSQVDGFLHIVRAFENDTVPHPYTDIDPARDVEIIDSEFLLEDMTTVEKRLAKIADEIRIKGKKVEAQYAEEAELLKAIQAHLEEEKPLRDFGLTDEQKKGLRGFGFLSLKPILVVVNMGDEAKAVEDILTYVHQNSALVGLQGKLEAEIAQLDDADDIKMFMDEYGITELSRDIVIRLSYQLMNIQSFFTVGEQEAHAWTIPVGATAPEAAGVIHSDLQKGFIRAEVMHYQDYLDAGSEAEVKKQGKMHLEGKEYIVQDGDILNIRFNV
jgi:GTP-binding protein YchF